LALPPIVIGITGRWFAGESEPAFGRAFDVGMKKRWSDFHEWKLLYDDRFGFGNAHGHHRRQTNRAGTKNGAA
jgi:hypothetical protein